MTAAQYQIQEQADPIGVKVREEALKVLEAEAQPVRRPCLDHIEAAAGSVLSQGIEHSHLAILRRMVPDTPHPVSEGLAG
jgi:hypothetical protein